ncbi:MAG: DUF3618 domain-containing protein [Actinobacteria bacterium]|nr:DUF3618 domain-containing protein [Actinomycetota bacterium]
MCGRSRWHSVIPQEVGPVSTDEAARTQAAVEKVTAEVERAALDGEVVARRSNDPATIEAEIARRREHLAATVDELVERAHPKALAARGVEDAKGRLQAAVRTPQGDLRAERVGAVAAAVALFVLLSVVLRRRGRKR